MSKILKKILLIFCSVIFLFFLGLILIYVFRIPLKNQGFKFIQKKYNIRKIDISGIKLHSLNKISVTKILFDKDDELMLDIDKFQIELFDYKTIKQRKFLAKTINFEKINLTFRYSAPPDTEPLDLKKLIVFIPSPIEIKIDSFTCANFNLNYSDDIQKLKIINANISSKLSFDSQSLNLSLDNSSEQINYTFGNFLQSQFQNVKLQQETFADTNNIVNSLKLTCQTQLSFPVFNFAVEPAQFKISNYLQIALQNKKISNTTKCNISNILNTNFQFDLDYDTFINRITILLEPTNVNINRLTDITHTSKIIENLTKTKLPNIKFQTLDKSKIFYDFNSNAVLLENFDCKIDVNDLNFNYADLAISDLDLSAKIKSDIKISEKNQQTSAIANLSLNSSIDEINFLNTNFKKTNAFLKLNTEVKFSENFNLKDLLANIDLSGAINNFNFDNISINNLKFSINNNNNFGFLPDFKIEKLFSNIDYSFSLDDFKMPNLIDFYGFSIDGKITKNDSQNISVLQSIAPDSFFSKVWISKIFESFDVYNVNTKLKKIILLDNYKLQNSSLLLTGRKNNQNIDISFISDNFDVQFDTQIFKIPQIKYNINAKSEKFNSLKLNAKISSQDLLNFHCDFYVENNSDFIKQLFSENKQYLDIYKNTFIRLNDFHTNIDLSKLVSVYSEMAIYSLTGKIVANLKLIKNINQYPVLSTNLKLDNINFEIKNFDVVIKNLNFDFALADVVLTLDNLANNINIDEYIKNPILDKNSNFFINQIKFKDYYISNFVGHIGFSDNFLFFNNFKFDVLEGMGLLNAAIDIYSRRLALNSKLQNINIAKISQLQDTKKNAVITLHSDLNIENLMKSSNIVNINDINSSIYVKLDRNSILEFLAIINPNGVNFDDSKLRMLLKIVEPTDAKISLRAGLLNILINFDSKLVKNFKIERIPLNRLKLLKN